MRMASFVVYLVATLAVIILFSVAKWAFSASQTAESPAQAPAQNLAKVPGVDVAAALEAWLKRFDEHQVEMRKQLRPPATAQQIATLERKTNIKLPEDLRALYLIADGQIDAYKITNRTGLPNRLELPFPVDDDAFVGYLFGGYEFLSTDAAAKEWENWRLIYSNSSQAERDDFNAQVNVREGDRVHKHYANLRWLAFARDGGGNSYAVDMDPAPGGAMGQVIVIGSDENLRRVLAPSIGTFLLATAKRGFGRDVQAKEQRFYFDMED